MVSWAQISSGVCMTLAKLCWQLPRVACDSCHKKWVFSQSCYNSQQTFGGFPGTKCYERFFKSSYQRTTLKHTAKNQFCSVFGGKPNQALLLIPLTGSDNFRTFHSPRELPFWEVRTPEALFVYIYIDIHMLNAVSRGWGPLVQWLVWAFRVWPSVYLSTQTTGKGRHWLQSPSWLWNMFIYCWVIIVSWRQVGCRL